MELKEIRHPDNEHHFYVELSLGDKVMFKGMLLTVKDSKDFKHRKVDFVHDYSDYYNSVISLGVAAKYRMPNCPDLYVYSTNKQEKDFLQELEMVNKRK